MNDAHPDTFADDTPRSPRAMLVIAVMVVALWLAIGAGVYFAGRAKGWW